MSEIRIVLRLNERIAFDRDFSIQYMNEPRARRQEWVRSILRAGLAGIGGIPQGASISMATPALNAAAHPVTVAAAPVFVTPVAPIPAQVATVAHPVIKPVVKSQAQPGDLKGFFGVNKGTNPSITPP